MSIYAINNYNNVNNEIDFYIKNEYAEGALVTELTETVTIPARSIGDWHLIWLTYDNLLDTFDLVVTAIDVEPVADRKRLISAWGTLWDSSALMRMQQVDKDFQFNKDYPFMPNGETRINTNNTWKRFDASGMFPPGYTSRFYCRIEAERFTSAGHAQANISCDNVLTDGAAVSGEGNMAFRAQAKGYTEHNQPEVYVDRVECVVPHGPNERYYFFHTNNDSKGAVWGSGFILRDSGPAPYEAPEEPEEEQFTVTSGNRFGDLNNNAATWYDGFSNVPVGGPNPASALKTNAGGKCFFGAMFDTARKITRMQISGSNNDGYVGNSNPSVTVKVWGYTGTTVPTSEAGMTLLNSVTFTDATNESALRELVVSNATLFDGAAFTVEHNGSASATIAIGEGKIFVEV